jgi:DNA-binding PadR family transcriptional regulator
MLAILARGAAHGYELKRIHDELFGEVAAPVNVGQIYVTLGRLERDGLVARVTGDRTGAGEKDRKVYELTEVGHKALRSWLAEPSELPVGKSDVVLKLVAGLIRDSEIAPAVAEHRARCLEALRRLAAVRVTGVRPGASAVVKRADGPADGRADAGEGSGITGVDVAELLIDASVQHLQAELRWLDLVHDRLNGT